MSMKRSRSSVFVMSAPSTQTGRPVSSKAATRMASGLHKAKVPVPTGG